jgi:hypothetical protein
MGLGSGEGAGGGAREERGDFVSENEMSAKAIRGGERERKRERVSPQHVVSETER